MNLLGLPRGVGVVWRVLRSFCEERHAVNNSPENLANGGDNTPDDALLNFADLVMNTRTRDVRRGRRQIELTRTEYRLLELFLRNPRQVLTRELIFDRVWGFDFGPASNTLSVYIGYLRRKTESGGEPRVLHTIRGVGYMLRD